MSCKYTAGIFVFNQDKKLLVVHPTHSPNDVWSIPKGECLYGFKSEVIRELYEETNIKITEQHSDKIHYIGNYPYNNKSNKCLVAYYFFIPFQYSAPFIKELKCNSMVENPKIQPTPFPEVDEFKWVRVQDALQMIHDTQQRALIDFMDGNI